MPLRAAALGFRPHSGWAALVVVAGDGASVEVVDRRRVEMTDARHPDAKQPYHTAEELPLAKAAGLLDRYSKMARDLARRAVGDVMDDLRGRGYRLVGSGLLLASGRPLPRLEAILASHALIHTADGEHFRDALAHSCEAHGLRVTRIAERDLPARAGAVLKQPPAQLQATIASLGRGLGPPWTQDQKRAALLAWVVLAGSQGSEKAIPRPSR